MAVVDNFCSRVKKVLYHSKEKIMAGFVFTTPIVSASKLLTVLHKKRQKHKGIYLFMLLPKADKPTRARGIEFYSATNLNRMRSTPSL